jgi:hypothetical protein
MIGNRAVVQLLSAAECAPVVVTPEPVVVATTPSDEETLRRDLIHALRLSLTQAAAESIEAWLAELEKLDSREIARILSGGVSAELAPSAMSTADMILRAATRFRSGVDRARLVHEAPPAAAIPALRRRFLKLERCGGQRAGEAP